MPFDRDFTIRALAAALRDAGIGPELKRVGEFYGMAPGRTFAAMPDLDLMRLYAHTLGGEALPTPDERAFNDQVPF